MAGCTFCKIYEAGDEVFYENKNFFSRFDKFPISLGHTEIIPKKHIVSLFDLTKKEWEGLYEAISGTKQVIEDTDFKKLYSGFIDNPLNEKSVYFCEKMLSHVGIGKKPDAYNVGINEGEAAGRTIDHLHIHIIPRFFGDVEDYVGGIRHMIPGMGNYKK